MKCLFLCTMMLLLPACVTVSSVSTSPIPTAGVRKKLIKSSASNVIVLAIPFGNSFVDQAREDLESQCSKGSIEGILAKHQNTDYFFNFFSKQEVFMQGYCLASTAGSAESTSDSAPGNDAAKGTGPRGNSPAPTKVKAPGNVKKKG